MFAFSEDPLVSICWISKQTFLLYFFFLINVLSSCKMQSIKKNVKQVIYGGMPFFFVLKDGRGPSKELHRRQDNNGYQKVMDHVKGMPLTIIVCLDIRKSKQNASVMYTGNCSGKQPKKKKVITSRGQERKSQTNTNAEGTTEV